MRRRRGIRDNIQHGDVLRDNFLSRLTALTTLRSMVRELEDRRRFDPRRAHKPASSFSSMDRRLVVPAVPGKPYALSHRVAFSVPKKVAVCVRRAERKEVLHALGKTGTGARSPRRKRNNWSSVKC